MRRQNAVQIDSTYSQTWLFVTSCMCTHAHLRVEAAAALTVTTLVQHACHSGHCFALSLTTAASTRPAPHANTACARLGRSAALRLAAAALRRACPPRPPPRPRTARPGTAARCRGGASGSVRQRTGAAGRSCCPAPQAVADMLADAPEEEGERALRGGGVEEHGAVRAVQRDAHVGSEEVAASGRRLAAAAHQVQVAQTRGRDHLHGRHRLRAALLARHLAPRLHL